MSVVADGEYSIYAEKRVRARKRHECVACHEKIDLGHTYWNIALIYDGTAETIKRCERCQSIHKHLRELSYRANDGRWPDEQLACGDQYEDEWGKLPPEIAELAFVTQSQMQMRIQP